MSQAGAVEHSRQASAHEDIAVMLEVAVEQVRVLSLRHPSSHDIRRQVTRMESDIEHHRSQAQQHRRLARVARIRHTVAVMRAEEDWTEYLDIMETP